MWSILSALTLVPLLAGSDIKSDEVVVFFNTWAWPDADGPHWVVPIHGWIYEPEADSVRRHLAIETFAEALDLDDESYATNAMFRKRARYFIVDNERHKSLRVQLGEKTYPLDESGHNGHFKGTIRLPITAVRRLAKPDRAGRKWLNFRSVTRKSDPRIFAGTVQIIEPTGLSVVSDIDDTIKVSEVHDHKAVLANTFLREFKDVPGMAKAYQRWAASGASFHYVSSSPWQLYRPLTDFLNEKGFPDGSFDMKAFRWKDSSFFELFADPEKTKPKAIEPLLQRFPRRQFILVGDSGQKDPEVYAALARKYPEQISHVFIRDVTGESNDSRRYRTVFRDVPADRWRVFRDAGELTGSIP